MKEITIMIVDDSATSRSYVAKNLQVANIPVTEIVQVKNGREALDTIKTRKIDLLFLDINMPVMTGSELVEELAKENQMEHLRVVVISSEGNSKRIERLEQLGVKKFIRKPFTPELFSGLVSELFEVEK